MLQRFPATLSCLLLVLLTVCAVVPTAAHAKQVSVTEQNGTIRIHSESAPLGAVLKTIGQATGIQFHISAEARNNLITREIEAPDWKTALRRLLDAYDRLELWDPDLAASEIHILSGANNGTPQEPAGENRQASHAPSGQTPQTDRRFAPSTPRPGQPVPSLNREQLMLLSKGKLRDPFPASAFQDPGIRFFLEQFQVTPNSRGDAFLQARIKARRLLKDSQKKIAKKERL